MQNCFAASAAYPTDYAVPSESTRELYIDLMERCILGLIYEDPAQDPWSPPVFDITKRTRGLDWPLRAHSMIGKLRMDNLRAAVEHVIKRNVPGDLIETGAWRGGACIFMRSILKVHGVHNRYVWVADSFEGVPPPDPQRYPADNGSTRHLEQILVASLEEAQSNFQRYGLLDEQVRFLRGWFRDTLPTLKDRRWAVIRLDGDMYESTMDTLVNLYPKLSTGGYVIIDDYGPIPACRQA